MAVPEATVNQHNRAMARQNDVRCSWQTGSMKSEAQSEPVNHLANSNFRPRVPAPHSRHVAAALFRGDLVQASLLLGHPVESAREPADWRWRWVNRPAFSEPA